MAIGTLNAIFSKARRMSGRGDQLQLPDYANPADPNSVGLADYLNTAYNYHLPAKYRGLKLKDKYTFNTIAGVDTYPANLEKYTTFEMPCYVMKRETQLFTDPWSFYGVNFNWQSQTNFTSGTNSTGPYSGFTTGSPILRSVNNNPNDVIGTPNVPGVSQGYSGFPAGQVQNILITANISNGNTLNVTDDGNGNLIGNCTAGTINYATGQISNLIFTQAVPQGNQIQIQYNPIILSIPLSILYFQGNFTLRPVPDIGYTVEIMAYRQPTQALAQTPAGNGVPELTEWWEAVAALMTKLIYEDDQDLEGMAFADKVIEEKFNMLETRLYGQLGSQQVNTIYRDQLQYNYGSGGWGFGAST